MNRYFLSPVRHAFMQMPLVAQDRDCEKGKEAPSLSVAAGLNCNSVSISLIHTSSLVSFP